MNLRDLAAQVIDLLYPPACAHCGRVGAAWCDHCMDRLNTHPYAQRERTLTDGLTVESVAEHSGIVRDAIHAFKFLSAQHLAEPLGLALARNLSDGVGQTDLIVPVPLHDTRFRWRGYNQAALLAEVVAAEIGLPWEVSALIRTRSTGQQVGRDAQVRWQAVAGAFAADLDCISGSAVLLIDDVVTTGATLSACAAALIDAGARSVRAATIASA